MKLSLEMPPSANVYWRHVGNRVYLSQKAKDYKEYIFYTVRDFPKILGGVAIDVDIYRARKSGDADNRQKVLFDALQGIAYDNDSQICDFHVRRFDDKDNPRVELTFYEVEYPRYERRKIKTKYYKRK